MRAVSRTGRLTTGHDIVSRHCVVGPSSLLLRNSAGKPFSSSCVAEETNSRDKRRERLEKMEFKRRMREKRAVKQEHALEYNRQLSERHTSETFAKREQSMEMTKDLPPVDESLLQSIYQGLIEAKPEELALPSPNDDKPKLQLPSEQALLSDSEHKQLIQEIDERLRNLLAPGLPSPPDPDQSLVKSTRSIDLAQLVQNVEKAARRESQPSKDLVTQQPLLPLQDWAEMAIALVADETASSNVPQLFGLMKESGASRESIEQATIDTVAHLAERGEAERALVLIKGLTENGLPVPLSAHHYAIESMLPERVEMALKYLRRIEESDIVPLAETYDAVIRNLVSSTSPPHLVSRGWDLFAHSRLVSHPVPTVDLYTTMIEACARGRRPSAHRAVDLFTEMTHDNGLPPNERSYNALIRACAREGSLEYYNEALRFLRQMLDENVRPTRATFHSLLEGSRAHGDLARARWILVKMLAAGGDCTPDASTLGLVLQSYANYLEHRRKAEDAAKSASGQSDVGPAIAEADGDSLVQFVAGGSESYPGPMPQTKVEVVREARTLFVHAFGSKALPDPNADDPALSSELFALVEPTAFVLNSYLQLLAEKDTFEATLAFFNYSYRALRVKKNRFAYESVMARAERAEDREKAIEQAKSIFKEWSEQPRPFDAKNNSRLRRREADVMTGRNVSFMWASLMRILARNYEHVESLALLETFYATHPPSALVSHALEAHEAARKLPKQGSPMRLSSPIYPETTRRHDADRPPHVVTDTLQLVALRFKMFDDERNLARLYAITSEYERALRVVERVEVGREGAVQEARAFLKNLQDGQKDEDEPVPQQHIAATAT